MMGSSTVIRNGVSHVDRGGRIHVENLSTVARSADVVRWSVRRVLPVVLARFVRSYLWGRRTPASFRPAPRPRLGENLSSN
ncbi:hypothetical protein [Scytonema sp. PCC 10023]|uniref:hypothetical protein n=1 Tax=Scytonema sp. PCC 10023 TaxID=1680591 RepID=UPI0039C71781